MTALVARLASSSRCDPITHSDLETPRLSGRTTASSSERKLVRSASKSSVQTSIPSTSTSSLASSSSAASLTSSMTSVSTNDIKGKGKARSPASKLLPKAVKGVCSAGRTKWSVFMRTLTDLATPLHGSSRVASPERMARVAPRPPLESRISQIPSASHTPAPDVGRPHGCSMEVVREVAVLQASTDCSVALVQPEPSQAISLPQTPVPSTEPCSLSHIAKSWSSTCQSHLQTELAAYERLHELQDNTIPKLIGVYSRAASVVLTFKPSHRCLWLEASSDMPDVLKARCVAAFEDLHTHGMLHGDPQLRHMLVTPSGAVQLVDLHLSRPLTGDTKDEEARALEMRKVLWLLDMDDARRKEADRLANPRRGHRMQLRSTRSDPDVLMAGQEDETAEEPLDEDMLYDWVAQVERWTPRRFIVPGESEEQIRLAIGQMLQFLSQSGDEEATRFLEEVWEEGLHSDRSSARAEDVQPVRRSLRKRKTADIEVEASPRDSPSPTKRPRRTSSNSPAQLIPPPGRPTSQKRKADDTIQTASEQSLSSPKRARTTLRSSVGHVQSSRPGPEDAGPSKQSTRTSSRNTARPSLPPPPRSAPKAPIVRDYAYVPYNGPKGYYVPNPPLEARVGAEFKIFTHYCDMARKTAIGYAEWPQNLGSAVRHWNRSEDQGQGELARQERRLRALEEQARTRATASTSQSPSSSPDSEVPRTPPPPGTRPVRSILKRRPLVRTFRGLQYAGDWVPGADLDPNAEDCDVGPEVVDVDHLGEGLLANKKRRAYIAGSMAGVKGQPRMTGGQEGALRRSQLEWQVEQSEQREVERMVWLPEPLAPPMPPPIPMPAPQLMRRGRKLTRQRAVTIDLTGEAD